VGRRGLEVRDLRFEEDDELVLLEIIPERGSGWNRLADLETV
jgi:hypothetical protein